MDRSLRILTLTRYERLGSSSRVRFYQYFPFLDSQGVEIQNAPLLSDEYVQRLYTRQRVDMVSIVKAYVKRVSWLLHSRNFDLLWIEKEILPWLPAWGEFLVSKRVPYIVDYDDAVFHRYGLHQSKVIRTLLGTKIDQVMRHSKMVIAGNEYLANRAEKAGAQRIEYLPSVVDVNRYPVKQLSHKPEYYIGWIGSPVTAPYLAQIRSALTAILKKINVQMILIGAGSKDSLPGIPKKLIPWDESTEIEHLQSIDVGIMPLPDEPFERGKCGYKIVQYMASGLPVIASPVGINRKIVEHNKIGYLASNETEWQIAFEHLYSNIEKRHQMGLAGRKKAEEKYNISVTAPRLLELLRSASN